MKRRPSVSVVAASSKIKSGMYGSCSASRTTCRSAITNGRSLNGPAASAGTTHPSLIRPVSPQPPAWAMRLALARLGRRQAQLAADHADRVLHRPIGRIEPALVLPKLAQRCAGGRLVREPGPGLVRGHQLAGNRLGSRGEPHGQELPVEHALGGGGVPQVCRGGSEMVTVAMFDALKVGL